jgi:surface antigen
MHQMIAVQSSKFVLKAAGVAAAFALATGCMTGSDGRPSNQAMGTVIGAGLGGTVVGGVVGGALVGAIAGNLVGRALDDQERRRLAEATQRAFDAETNQPTVYTVEPQAAPASTTTTTTASQPTVVAAKPTAPKSTRSDGSTCRPIELTATKNGQTTTETTTFCQAAGSTELKPVNV